MIQKLLNKWTDPIDDQADQELNMSNRSCIVPDAIAEFAKWPIAEPSSEGVDNCDEQADQYQPTKQRMEGE